MGKFLLGVLVGFALAMFFGDSLESSEYQASDCNRCGCVATEVVSEDFFCREFSQNLTAGDDRWYDKA